MFKTCMKTYFGNLKYVFTVLGILFIFILIGVSTFVKASGSSMEAIAMEIGDATKAVDLNVLGTKGGFLILLGALKTYFYEIVAEVMTAIITLVTNVITMIGTILLGIFIANITVILFGRYDINHDNIFKVILEQLFRYLCILFCIFVILLLGYLFGFKIALILLALYPIGYCFIALFSAWVTCGKNNRTKWGETVTFKNMMLLLASNLLEIIMTVAIGLIAFYLFDMIVAAVIAIGLAVLVTATTNLNAYAFIYQKGSEATEVVVGVQEITVPKEELTEVKLEEPKQ